MTTISLKKIQPYKVGKLIRLGRNNDGGYIIPEVAIHHTHVLFGIGINDDWSFEEDFVRHVPSIKVIGVDGVVRFPWFFVFQEAGFMLPVSLSVE